MRRFQLHRAGFTLIELLVVISIIGVLIALLVPAVQRVREMAAATQCKNNLKQIALATTLFHDAQKAYPPARIVERPLSDDPPELRWGGQHPSWVARILPYLDQQAAADQWDVTKPYGDHPAATRQFIVPSFICPTRRGPGNALVPDGGQSVRMPCGCIFIINPTPGGATGDYAGNHGDLSPGTSGLLTDFYWGGYGTGVIISSRGGSSGGVPTGWIDRIRIGDVTDGTSSTFLIGEMHVPLGKVNSPTDNGPIYDGSRFYTMSRVGGPGVPIASGPTDDVLGMSLFAFGSWHPGICHFAFADGRVAAIAPTISTAILERLCNRSDGGIVPDY